MARPLRIQFTNAVYHVIARGNARGNVFLDDEDYRCFQRVLRHVINRLGWRIWTYCLMPNHYHLLLQTPEPNLARGMRDVNGLYSQLFNRRHARVGHVFQGRYKAILVDRDAYLLELARYITLNPLRAKLCDAPEAWRWNGFSAALGRTDTVMSRRDTHALLHQFSADLDIARVKFRDFVIAGIGRPLTFEAGPNRSIAGGPAFVAHAADHLDAPVALEVPREDRVFRTLEDFARVEPSRDDAMRAAYACGSYTIQTIARHFGLHAATVSRIIHRRPAANAPMFEYKT